jgi:hypothetical protein
VSSRGAILCDAPAREAPGRHAGLDYFPPGLLDIISYKGEIYSVPVNIHRSNVLWYNRQALADAGLEPPGTVEELLDVSERLAARGVIPLALGDRGIWASTHLRESLLLGTVRPEQYRGLWTGLTPWDGPEVRAALRTFARLMSYVNTDHAPLSWDRAAQYVIEGTCPSAPSPGTPAAWQRPDGDRPSGGAKAAAGEGFPQEGRCPRRGASTGSDIPFSPVMGAPHDEFFRRAFGTPDRARGLARVALPGHIGSRLDLGTIQILPGSYTDPRLHPLYSDLLLQTCTRGRKPILVYILFEHKSSPERTTPYQLLRYMVGIWDGWVSREENRGWRLLPPIIPVIVCNGRRPWTYSLDFASLVGKAQGLDLEIFTPRFSALLVDLARTDDAELGKDGVVRGLLRILKHVQTGRRDELASALRAVQEIGLSERHSDLVKVVLTYLVRARQTKSTRAILELLPSDGLRRDAMTMADILDKKGREAGRIEDKQEVLKRQLDRKFGLTEEEGQLVRSQADPQKLDAALDALVFADSKGAVLEHLRSLARPKAKRQPTSTGKRDSK